VSKANYNAEIKQVSDPTGVYGFGGLAHLWATTKWAAPPFAGFEGWEIER